MALTPEIPTSTFALDKVMNELKFRSAKLLSRDWLAPGYVRLRVSGPDLQGFSSPGPDDHVRLFFAPVGEDLPDLETARSLPSREYTPLDWDADAGWADFEFVIHDSDYGPRPVASDWAATAPLGSAVAIGGPRGSKVFVGRPEAFFLAGDETAIPAIRRYASLLAGEWGLPGQIVLEHSVGTEISLVAELAQASASVSVHYLDRENLAPGVALAQHLASLAEEDKPAGELFAFVAAEKQIVKPARELLLERWELSADQITVKGYWKQDSTEYHAPH